MNWGQEKKMTGTPWGWGILLLVSSLMLFVFPVQAEEQWSEYAKIGPTSNNALGGFLNPSGVAVDNIGNIYVADNTNHRIQKLTAATGAWSEWKKDVIGPAYGSGLGEFSNPNSVSVDNNGNVYVADASNHRVQKLTVATGEWSEWKKPGGGAGSGLGEFNNPRGVAVDSHGNVYVADAWNHRIQKLDAATGVWSEWKKSGGGLGNGLGQFNMPSRVAIDSSGNIYVADTSNHRVQKLTAATGEWSEWKKPGGGAGSGLGEFNNPYDVSVDSQGNVYVAELNNHRIQKLDAATGEWSEWKKNGGGPGGGLGEFYTPKGIAVDSDGNLYVADSGNARIQKLTAATGGWSEWVYEGAIPGEGLGEFSYPSGVTTDNERNLYVADYDNHRIQKLNAATGEWSEWKKIGGGYGDGLGEFENPNDVAVDAGGNVYVVDRFNHRIQKLTAATGIWTEWKKNGGGQGSGLGEFDYPGGVAVDHDGNMYVADTNNNRIQKLDAATGEWNDWKKAGGGSGSGLGEFRQPASVEVDSDGNVYVADTGNNRIQKLDAATGEWNDWKKAGGGSGSGLGEFDEPSSVAVAANGDIYVADLGNHRIQKLELSSGVWSQWKKRSGGEGSGLGEFASPSGVAVDSTGTVYVADFGNSRIQKLITFAAPAGVPGVPTDVTAEVAGGESQATVHFTAPANDGGSPVTGYTVLSNPGGRTGTGTSSPITVTGLTYGTAYTFTVVATNSVGSSGASAASNSVTPTAPAGVPGVPTDVTAEVAGGESQATVHFTAPANDGGSPVTGYTVLSNPGGRTGTGTSSPITVTGLTYGTAYTFTVVATNSVGSSGASAASNSVMPTAPEAPADVPGAPTSVTAAAGGGGAIVSFHAPATDGGSRITSYIVTSSPGGLVAAGASSPITVTGLTYGTAYTFTVVAINRVGSSPASDASNVIRLESASNRDNSDTSDSNDSSGSGQPQPAAPTMPDPAGAVVLVNGKVEHIGALKITSIDSQSAAIITIDQSKLAEKLAEEGPSAVVTIVADAKADIVRGELNGQMVHSMELQQAVLELKTDKATYHLPAKQIDIQSISERLGKSPALQDIQIQIEIAVPQAGQWATNPSAEGTISIIAPPIDFTIKAVYKDEIIEITAFNAYVERTIAIPDDTDPGKITTGVVVEADGTLRHVPTRIVQLDGKYYAKINSMTNSTYSVVWHPVQFQDMELHWAKEAVHDMGSRMVINGIGQGNFHPDQDITRAEFAAILVRGLGLRPEPDSTFFSDVHTGEWFAGAIGTAFKYNLISGFEDGAFRPNDKITREQAMVIMARAMSFTGLAEAAPSQDGPFENSFSDAGKISVWAKGGSLKSLQTGLVSGRNSKELAPQAFMTRAEVAVMVQRLLQKSGLI
ncbi:fibronectin type III domain-containing protein [Paenibacillus sp. y28]|uniref:fibronectin type III domain-containing protein n=1 Tax=Paenibacillus sp. y28 TaxID=3129110 RepID=UPI00301AD398